VSLFAAATGRDDGPGAAAESARVLPGDALGLRAVSVDFLRGAVVKLSNPLNGRAIFARPVDFGPGDGSVIDGEATPDTGRIADLSPGAATALGLMTDEVVRAELVV
jgi:hypothetical protein